MEKIYRWIILLGLLAGLVVNAVAVFQLRLDIANMNNSVYNLTEQMKGSISNIAGYVHSSEKEVQDQIAEHERLIMELEKLVNFELDQ